MKFTLEQARNSKVGQRADNQALLAAAAVGPVGGLSATQPKPDPLPALEQGPRVRPRSKGRLAVIVTLIRVGGRSLDSDNLAISFKAIRDAISNSLGLDDADKRIRWEYTQCPGGRGVRKGTIVKIDLL